MNTLSYLKIPRCIRACTERCTGGRRDYITLTTRTRANTPTSFSRSRVRIFPGWLEIIYHKHGLMLVRRIKFLSCSLAYYTAGV